MRYIYFLVFAFTVFLVEQMLIDYPGKGQEGLYDAIIFTGVGLTMLGYGITLYLTWRENRNAPKYPSTVRARLSEGFRNGAAKK